MKIGLISVDSKIPNLALMKISAHHKENQDEVYLYNPLFSEVPDILYSSKIFKFSPDFEYYPENCKIIKGGSGFSLASFLEPEIENIYPDYSLFNCDFALGFTSRGCFRKCSFCIVPEKEGKLRPVTDIYSFWKGQKKISLLDNNIIALPDHFKLICSQVKKENIEIDFNQGLDIRLINKENAKILSELRIKTLRFSWDNVNDEKYIDAGFATLQEAGVRLNKLMVFCIIGFNSTRKEDLYRVNKLKKLGITPFAMPFDKSNKYQKQFALWVNQTQIFKVTTFEEYHTFKRQNKLEKNKRFKYEENNLKLAM